MSSNIRILIKINYICSVFYFIRQFISTTNSIESRFISIIRLYFKVCQWVWSQKFLDPQPALIVLSSALITPLPASIFPDKLAPSVPSNILRKPTFCSLTSIFTVSVIPFNNIPFLREIYLLLKNHH